jgi:hypothetical protein
MRDLSQSAVGLNQSAARGVTCGKAWTWHGTFHWHYWASVDPAQQAIIRRQKENWQNELAQILGIAAVSYPRPLQMQPLRALSGIIQLPLNVWACKASLR